jgi:hypothetical protein
MNNNPNIFMYGESDGDKKGIQINGGGNNLYEGSFNVELHGVEMKNIGIKNDCESIVNMSDIKTNSPIVNTGKSNVNMKRVEIKRTTEKQEEKWWNKSWFHILELLSFIAVIIGLFFYFR